MKVRSHELLVQAPGDLVIWRYMDLAKFLDIVINQRIFFGNMKNLPDRYEGAIPDASVEEERQRLVSTGLEGRDLEEELARYVYFSGHLLRDCNLVNCWASGDTESYALWKIYLGGSSGVAVRSTVSRLCESLEGGGDPYPEDVYVFAMIYRDSLPLSDVSRFSLMSTKRPYYEYEKEVRACLLRYPRSEGGESWPCDFPGGRYVQVNLTRLVESIYVSPFVESWQRDVVVSILESFAPELSSRIADSGIEES